MADAQVGRDAQWRSWIFERLTEAGYDSEQGAAIKNAVNELAVASQGIVLGSAELRTALLLLAEFVIGRAVPDNLSLAEQESATVWYPLVPGGIQRGMRVRVRHDAYSDEKHWHNGVTGRIVGIRSGVVAVQYDGAPIGSVVHHPQDKLQCAV